jgi:hypothetical protein
MIGSTDLPLLEGIDLFDAAGVERDIVRFPTRQFPAQWTGDEHLIYYAVGGTKKIFAAAKLTDAPVKNFAQRGERWPHTATVRFDPTTVVRDLRYAPELIRVDFDLLGQVSKDVSWLPMNEKQFNSACDLLRRCRQAAPTASRRPL